MNFLVLSEGSEEKKMHQHEFKPCDRQRDLTTPQMRKLVFYQGPIGKCVCGAVRLTETSSQVVYSRNGSRM